MNSLTEYRFLPNSAAAACDIPMASWSIGDVGFRVGFPGLSMAPTICLPDARELAISDEIIAMGPIPE